MHQLRTMNNAVTYTHAHTLTSLLLDLYGSRTPLWKTAERTYQGIGRLHAQEAVAPVRLDKYGPCNAKDSARMHSGHEHCHYIQFEETRPGVQSDRSPLVYQRLDCCNKELTDRSDVQTINVSQNRTVLQIRWTVKICNGDEKIQIECMHNGMFQNWREVYCLLYGIQIFRMNLIFEHYQLHSYSIRSLTNTQDFLLQVWHQFI